MGTRRLSRRPRRSAGVRSRRLTRSAGDRSSPPDPPVRPSLPPFFAPLGIYAPFEYRVLLVAFSSVLFTFHRTGLQCCSEKNKGIAGVCHTFGTEVRTAPAFPQLVEKTFKFSFVVFWSARLTWSRA